MSNINVEILLQPSTTKDKLFMSFDALRERLELIAANRRKGLRFNNGFPDLEDITITHNMFVTKEYKPFAPIAFIYSKAQRQPGNLSFGNSLHFTTQYGGSFIGDIFANIQLSTCNSADSALPNSVARDMIRYCKLPGARLIKKCDLLFNNVVSSSFNRMNMIHYLNHELPKQKLPRFFNMLGNEKLYEGELNARPGFTEYRSIKKYGTGAQTFKTQQNVLNIYYPLIFWFTTNSEEVLVNRVADKISVKLDLEDVDKMIEKLATGTNGPITYPTVDVMDVWYKDIFVSHQVYDIYVATKKYQVISTWRFQEFDLAKSSDTLLLVSQDWPIERLYFSYIPTSTDNNMQNWYKGYVLTSTDIPEFTSVLDTTPLPPATYYLDTQLSRVYKETLPINLLTIKTASITYYDKIFAEFFTNYETDFNDRLSTGESGSMVVNFDYKPNTKGTSSGYSSTSNNTDFNFEYAGTYFSTINTGKLHVSVKVLDCVVIDTKILEIRYN